MYPVYGIFDVTIRIFTASNIELALRFWYVLCVALLWGEVLGDVKGIGNVNAGGFIWAQMIYKSR